MNTVQLPPLSQLLEPKFFYNNYPQQTLPPFLRFPVSLIPSHLSFPSTVQPHSIELKQQTSSPLVVLDSIPKNTQCESSSDESLNSSDIEITRPSKTNCVVGEEVKIFASFVESLSSAQTTNTQTMSARIREVEVKMEKSKNKTHVQRPASPSTPENVPTSPKSPSTPSSAPGSPTSSKLPSNFAPKFKTKRSRSNKGIFEGQWMEHYTQLKEFRNQFGHTNVTRNTPSWGYLGNWVADQRRKLRRGKLTEKQFSLLCELNFEWDRTYYFQPTVYGEKSM